MLDLILLASLVFVFAYYHGIGVGTWFCSVVVLVGGVCARFGDLGSQIFDFFAGGARCSHHQGAAAREMMKIAIQIPGKNSQTSLTDRCADFCRIKALIEHFRAT